MTRRTRRDLLRGLAVPAGVAVGAVAARKLRSSPSGTGPGSDFEPVVDGFGFDNYATPLTAVDPSEFVSESDVRTFLTAGQNEIARTGPPLSTTDVSELLGGAFVSTLYANAEKLFGTKGNCYGIAGAAQWYAEVPDAVPIDHASVSEITHVNEPLEDEDTAPVRNDIERLHRSQFLDADSWAARWPLLDPRWIDYREQARELRVALDTHGTAGVTLTGEDVLQGHYVLLYDYEATETAVTFAVYDPNDTADEYETEGRPRTLGIDTTSGEPLLGSYRGTYDRFLYNPNERAVRAQARPDRDG
ncbi:hypothetical protein RBH26_03355 [Natronolimnohabitans sp. A-GB9]|uniref:hypothetical protein n=1 Tax=Natronolimnohabitans sp. A-GB9 TaxID=3069757 RepID=UPI0027B74119|nr:hypothetical protein [Natronolimnohabitans sp. A-GB9]MDQ2049513.1 hypothetical protein [Natronolimnohabitans sp. A-GB9]